MKEKVIYISFQGLLVANRPETAPLAIVKDAAIKTLAIKKGHLCNFTENLKGTLFYRI